MSQSPYDMRDKSRFVQPKVNTTSYGLKSFAYYGSHIWNLLPMHIKSAMSLPEFKELLTAWSEPTCKCTLCTVFGSCIWNLRQKRTTKDVDGSMQNFRTIWNWRGYHCKTNNGKLTYMTVVSIFRLSKLKFASICYSYKSRVPRKHLYSSIIIWASIY